MTTCELATLFDSLSRATPARLGDKLEGSIGIVTAAAGLQMTVNVWLLCRRLQELGCALPIDIVHAHAEAIPDRVRDAFPANARFRSLDDAPPGFAIKPLALWTSRFDRCLWLDADNLPLRDPTFLVSEPGPARFWPDAFRTSSAQLLAAIDRPLAPIEFESGQMVVPTRACERALWFARELNETHRPVIHRHVYGDKDTWRIAWALAGEPADVVSRLPLVVGHECTFIDLRPLPVSLQWRVPGARPLDVGLVQHGPDGTPLFLHRTVREWHLFDGRDTISWAKPLDAQVTIPRLSWRPGETSDVPRAVSEAVRWGRDRLGQIEWFPQAFGVALPTRLWLKYQFAIEATFAAAVAQVRGRHVRPVAEGQELW